jgi:hypothetical protein
MINNKKITKMLRSFVPAVLIVSIGIVMYSCSTGSLTDSGSGTGVGNGFISGKVIHPDSTPVSNAVVRLRSENYLADTSGKADSRCNDTIINTTTDKSGSFRIDSLTGGKKYFIEVVKRSTNENDSGTLYIADYKSAKQSDTVKLETRIIQPVKVLEGTVTISGLPRSAYIQVYGLERITRSDSSGNFIINNLPVGQCEENECEYRIRVTIPQMNGTVKVYNSELEIKYDRNNNIIKTEFELEDDDESDD